jgi:serine phosphatase RsbU (regulator of sigma subunit)
MKQYLFVVLMLFQVNLSVFSQTLSELRDAVQQNQGAKKVDALNALSEYYRENYDVSIALRGNAAMFTGLQEAKEALKLASALKYVQGEGHSHHNIGRYYYYKAQKNPVFVIEHYQNALEKYLQSNESDNIIQVKNELSLMYADLGDYNKALSYVLEAIKDAEKNQNNLRIGETANTISSIYEKLGNYPKARSYAQIALEKDSVSGDSVAFAMSLNNLGAIYQEEKQYSIALNMYLEAHRILTTNEENSELLRYIQSGIGEMLIEQGEYNNALEYLFPALKSEKEAQDEEGIAINSILIGRTYMFKKDYARGLSYLEKARQIAIDIGSNEIINKVYKNLADIYEKTGNYTEALKYEREHLAIKDSIYKMTNIKHLSNIQSQYELDKKQREIALLTKEQEQERREKWFMGIAILLIFIVLLFIVNMYVSKKRSSEKLEVQKKQILEQNEQLMNVNQDANAQKREIEEQSRELNLINKKLKETYTHLKSSVNYAKRIQEAVLPPVEQVTKTFDDSFVFYEPRDIVSGDFYWLSETDDKIILVVADSTGHGVPGGFMSMLGDAYLNQIIRFQNINSPILILELLHHYISLALNQGRTENSDGMDLTISVIDKKEKVLSFAGAKNPLVYVQDGKVHHIRGNKIAVGGMKNNESRLFVEHQIKITSTTEFYTYTDGYQDQFGGAKGRKFMSKNFRDLLVSKSAKPMSEQVKNLEETLKEWMGDKKQIDDILVVGFRINPDDLGLKKSDQSLLKV